MEQYHEVVTILALTLGVGWASGVNLYAAVLMLGLMGATGGMTLSPDLEMLANPLVIGAAGLMYFTEFFADKVPGVDTGWDAMHTFIRIPAGALLAAGAVGEVSPALELAAGLLGGGMAFGAHAAKSGSRIMVNTSPEPVSNWSISLAEDAAVFAGIWAMVYHPWIMLGVSLLLIVLMIWLLPKLLRVIVRLFRGIAARLRGDKPVPEATPASNSASTATVPGVTRSTGETQQPIALPPPVS